MKTRTALIYLVLFLIIAGYFYYFEVIQREARLKQEEAAQHLFQLDKAQVTALQLVRADSEPILLKKNGRWLIDQPMKTRADDSVVENLLNTVQGLKMERQVKSADQNLQLYGLDKPKLRLAFLSDGDWHYLRIGDRAAVGDKFYASGDQQDLVVLIAGSQQRLLEKKLFDLRSKDLLTLKSEEVDRIEIERSDGKLVLTRLESGRWQASAEPKLKIKTAKVESLLNRLVWLRATRFVDQEKGNIARYGLAPARIRVNLSTPDRTETVLLGNTEKDEGIYAKGVGLPGVAIVDEKLLEELPVNLYDLEDRTLLTFEPDRVKAITLELGDQTAKLERDAESWLLASNGDRKAPENWLVNSLLWKLQELEYLPEAPADGQSLPHKRDLDLDLFSENEEKIGTFLVPEVPSDGEERGMLWFLNGDGTPSPYWVNGEVLRSLYSSASRLVTPDS